MGFWDYLTSLSSNDNNLKKNRKSVVNMETYNLAKVNDEAGEAKDKNSQDEKRVDVDKPLWNQNTYFGRWKHFAFVTDVRTIFAKDEDLQEAKKLCELYKSKNEPAETKTSDILWAKKLKDSSFHPDNGELMNVIGRMSFQLPGNVFLTAGMLTFYKTAKATIAWQIMNQAFNATVNYTNRNAAGSDEVEDTEKIKQAFLAATLASCLAALSFRKFLSSRGNLSAVAYHFITNLYSALLYGRWAPFFAVAAGNMTNLPIMRQIEIKRGIPLFSLDNDTKPIINSKVAAVKAISECVISRIAMAAPGMLIIPVIMARFEPYCFYQRRPWIGSTMEIGMVGLFLLVMIPTALAIYPQRNSMTSDLLKLRMPEYEEYQKIIKTPQPTRLYYNKGL